jgi:hypothetical protein
VTGRVTHGALGQKLLRDGDRVDRGRELLGGENVLQNIVWKRYEKKTLLYTLSIYNEVDN